MHRRHLALLLFVLVFLAGCPVPWDRLEGCAEFDACSTSEPAGSTSTGAEFPTTATPTTGDESAGDPSGSSAAPDTDEPLSPPVILSVELPELPITTCGGYPLLAHTLHADGVRLTAEDGEVIDLSQVGPDTFTGELIALTGLDNGAHVAELVPWRDGILGQSELVDYEISLPDAGSERYWDAGALLGKGVVASLGILPDGRVVDFGTIYDAMNVPGCYLRVHDAEGMWSETDDVVRLLPGQHCQAVDLTIDPDSGILHVLAHRETMDGVRWWVGQVAGWGAGLKTVATGPLDVQAQALAAHPEMIAVCGARPAPEGMGDLDAFAVLLRPGQADEERLYDYVPPGTKDPHLFSETIHDCIFAADTLVLVGEAYGQHDGVLVDPRDRLLLIEDDVLAGTEAVMTVAGPGPGTQSRAHAVTVDDEGRYLVAGSFCFDECEPAGELRRYEPGGEMTWQASLGPLGSEWFGPHGIAWSPAGYVVIARGRLQAQAWAFNVEAYAPDKPGTPLWSYTPMFVDGQQLAVDVIVGDCGTVHAGGLGASNYPAIAGVNG